MDDILQEVIEYDAKQEDALARLQKHTRFKSFEEVCEQYKLQLNDETKIYKYNYAEIIVKIFNSEFEPTEEQLTDTTILNSLAINAEINCDYKNAIKYYEKASMYGCMEANCNLGYFYSNIELNPALAEKHYKIASDCNHEFSMLALSNIYVNHNKIEDAFQLLQKAVELKNSANAHYFMGLYYEKCIKNYEKAVEHYEISANKEYADAHYSLGLFYANVEKNNKKSIHHHCEAIRLGKLESACYLGGYYQFKSPNENLMKQCYDIAIMGGITLAMYNMGLYYKDKNEYDLMKQYFEKGVQHEDVDSMYALGYHYEIVEKQYETALQYYLKAIEKGFAPAMNSAGFIYQINLKNNMMAKKYYLMSAKLNDEIGVNNLKKLVGDVERLYLLMDFEAPPVNPNKTNFIGNEIQSNRKKILSALTCNYDNPRKQCNNTSMCDSYKK